MNCQVFRSVVRELTNNSSNQLVERKKALVHADSCALCSKILEAERALSLGLRHLADNDADKHISPSVEARLLASFRALHSNNKPEPAEPVAVIAPASFNRTGPIKRASVWSIAIAASVFIFTILIGAHFVISQKGEPVAEANLSSVKLSLALELDWQRMIEPVPQEKDKVKQRRVSSPKNQSVYAAVYKAKRRNFDADKRDGNQPKEIVTEFISLVPGNDILIPDSGQVYRVKLSRSALASFGLPINMERAGDQIMADVIVSEDGMARAIRFVRDN